MGVGVAQSGQWLCYGLADPDPISGRRKGGIFSLRHCNHTCSGESSTCYPMDTENSFYVIKAVRSRRWPLTSI